MRHDSDFLELYLAGETDKEIADTTHYAEGTVREWRFWGEFPANRGTQPRADKGKKRKQRLVKWHDDFIEMYNRGKTDGVIADFIGVNRLTILRYRNSLGLEHNDNHVNWRRYGGV